MTAAATPTACLSSHGRAKVGYRPGPRLRRALRVSSREAGTDAREYLCPGCGLRHVTTKPERAA